MNLLSTIVARLGRTAALNLAFVGMTFMLTLVAWLGIAFLQSKVNRLEQDIAERMSMLEHGDQLGIDSQRVKQQIASVKVALQSLYAKLPESPEESQFLHQLSECALETGVSLSDFRPGGITERPNCKDIDLRLRGTGSYASVCRWLDRLNNLPRVVRISHVAIAGPTMAGEDCMIDLQLNLVFGVSAQPPLAALVKQ